MSFPADSVRAQLEKILASEALVRSARLKRFLRFIVEQVVRGSADQLKEYVVGLEVFDRKQAYDPRTDPIVRVEAQRLRGKLKEYYRSNGRKDRLLIELPKGTYVPVFRLREPKPDAGKPARSRHESVYERRTIAVLPFADLSPQKDQEYFCRGIAQEIINDLTHVERLRVASRTSAFQFSGPNLDLREVGRKLNVGALLQGSVQKAGERVRVIVQLTNVADGYHVWSEKYDQELKDVFGIEDQISRAVVNALRAKLEGLWARQLVRQRPRNLAAYDLYLKGRYHLDRCWSKGWLAKSLDYFQQAIAQDPTYAPAYAGMAESYSLAAFYGALPPREVMEAARAAATKAVEIDATVGAAHTSLAVIKTLYDWDWPGAEQEFEYALDLQPDDADTGYWHAHYLESMGWFDEAIVEKKRALEVSPLSPLINVNLAVTYYFKREYGEAVKQSHRAIEFDPRFAGGFWSLGVAYEQEANYEEAIKALQQAMVLSGGDPWIAGALGHCYALAGKTAAAREVLEELELLSKGRYVSPISIALINVGLGETDRAFEWLEEAYAQRDGGLIFLNVNPAYDRLRTDPRLSELARRVGLPAPR